MSRWISGGMLAAAAVAGPAVAQTPDATPSGEAPSFRDEHRLFAYVENSFTANLSGSGRGGVNELRLYDYHEGYTFNIAEFSLKKDPSERYPFGYGLVVTAGIDAQKNHSLGIFRDEDDAFPFRNTEKFDLQEAYLSGRLPIGRGLTLKGGKFVTLLGYEVIESPSNLNFSRGYLFSLAIPLTHTGGLVSYAFTDWLSVTGGVVLGWDDSKNVNDRPSYTGQLALIPFKDFTATLSWIAGPEQMDNTTHQRYVLDWVLSYTGFKNLTLALNVDYGHEDKEPFVGTLGTRRDTDARWWGWAGYVAYDWTERLRTAVRQEFFRDAAGARTGSGIGTDLWSTTATVQYKIWKGLVGRVEYQHDQSDEKVFRVRYSRPDITSQGLLSRGKSMDTISVSLYYSFF